LLVTGRIGAGKSLVCEILEKLGLSYFNSDQVVAQIYEDDQDLVKKLTKTFGQEILSHGKICKSKLSRIVFQDKKRYNDLQRCMHPRVKAKLKEVISTLKSEYLLIEMPLIHTTILGGIKIKAAILVQAKQKLRQKRWMQKGFSQEDFFLRESHQNEDFLRTTKIYNITNNSSVEDLQGSVQTLFNKIKTNTRD
jgi:dephospho-CoA kinase